MNETDVYESRKRRVTAYMKQAGAAQILISAVPSIFWLTGLWAEPHERMLTLYLDADGETVLFANRICVPNGADLPFELVCHSDGADPVKQLASRLRPGAVGIDKTWAARFLLALMALRPDIRPCPGSAPVDRARMCKDSLEIEQMRAASRMNDKTMAAVTEALREGVTEARMAAYAAEIYAGMGADFPIGPQIVCFGENAADPHHMPDQTALQAGGCALFDLFTPLARYWCDMTRTVYFKSVGKEEETIYEIVRTAHAAAVAAIRPGLPLQQIDAAARAVIAAAGYGAHFTHRLGHGAGLECHEPPDCSAASDAHAEAGMIFSVEPGVYIPGRFGVRVEDLILVTETGCETLTHFPRDLRVIR
jgi:Xaa-Pro dipeptidase